jgi:CubicO group peptidase (beta-lactamase class C family)
MGYLEVESLLKDAVKNRIGSGIAAGFGNLHHFSKPGVNHEIFVGVTSHLSNATLVGSNTLFDLASLTKILATTTLAMKRFEQGRLNLDASLEHPAKLSQITVRELLTHSSGLPAWKPIYEEMKKHFGEKLSEIEIHLRKQKFDELLSRIEPEFKPNEKVIYSDIGFLHLENFLSKNFKSEVESLWHAMGVSGLHFRPVFTDALSARLLSEQKHEHILATENCPWRGLLVGQVHDDNAWSRGGVAGHAGTFGRLQDVRAWIEAVFLSGFFSKSTLSLFTKEAVSISGVRRALGFDLASVDGTGSTAFYFSKNTVGHLGFTGTSLWIDLDSGDYAILLTNRVHPNRDDTRIRGLRREFHRCVRNR